MEKQANQKVILENVGDRIVVSGQIEKRMIFVDWRYWYGLKAGAVYSDYAVIP